ncbi:hypothetical protein Vretimale_19803 [Volvox reticuliferus]|uniref:AAA+ ATPase domain-containing protein n=1 Tax=Volvox reticuliferus TaxID=1737510 RepID=A0A8J4M008_9CHLO|nr:hypothetical protein Vretifemale_14954 [Volvox reticuliferus]GIM17260.1 hypothetical protein Vretimale_19803 [Volvox reticuliferus]
MSKRPRAAVGTRAGKQQAAASEAVEVINLLEDSSPSEDDPDDFAVQHTAPPSATGAVMRPTKRLRRLDRDLPTQQLQQQQRPQRSALSALASAGRGHASASALSGSRCRQPTGPPANVAKALRQGTLPVSSMPPRTTALPFQPLNVNRRCAMRAAAPAASSDSAPAGIDAGGEGGSPGPSTSPSLSQRSMRGSPDPEYTPVSPSQSPSRGSSQPTVLLRDTRKHPQQSARPNLRQLTFAPARTIGNDIAAGSARGTPFPTARKVALGSGPASTAAHGAPDLCPSRPSGSTQLPHTSPTVGLGAEMWHERHAPRNEEELVQVMHRKKVLEVKDWLERQRTLIIQGSSQAAAVLSQRQCYPEATLLQQQTQMQDGAPRQVHQATPAWPGGSGFNSSGSGSGPGSRFRLPCGLAVLSGPSGCGKSACLRVLAMVTGFEVVEWTPPAPVMWNEHQYQRPTGGVDYGSGPPGSYQSKLDDFESFVSRSKYPSLALAAPLTVLSASAGIDKGMGQGPGQAIASAATRGSSLTSAPVPRPKLLLIEDLPHTHDAERRQRLVAALRDLAATARGPVVLVATEVEGQPGISGRSGGSGPDGGGPMGSSKGLQKDILVALQSAGATTISFNPVTANNIAKLLMRVAAAEGLELSPAAAVGLAEAADGDVRSALQALQMNAMLQKAALRGAEVSVKDSKSSRRGGGGRTRDRGGKKGSASTTTLLRVGRQQALTPGEVARLVAAQRDLGVPLFHALGKFLYNKRGGGGTVAAQGGDDDSNGEDDDTATAAAARGRIDKKDKDSVALQQLNSYSLAAGRQWKLQHAAQLPARLLRPPMRYDPEAILLRCGLEAPVLLSFLHENYPSFVDREAQDAMDDVATVTAYLSDSAVLCGQSRASAIAATAGGGTSLWLEDSPATANLSSAIAASVAARGLMYGNTHPAPHCFNPIRAPASSAINQAAAANRLQLQTAACRLSVAGGSGGAAAFSTSWDGSSTTGGTAGVISVLFGGGSAAQLVSTVMPWLRSLVQMSPQHAVWLAPLLPNVWSYYWNGAVTEGAFLRHVATLPPPYQQQHRWQQNHCTGWGGCGRVAGAAVSTARCQPGVGGGGSSHAAMESMLEQMGLEDEDPIES